MYILSQVFVVISGILFALSYLTKKKSLLLILNVVNNLFFGCHFLLLKSFTAAYSVFLIIVFLIAVYVMEKYKKEKFSFIAVVITSMILIPITIFTWDGLLSLIPTIAVFLTFVGSGFKNTLTVKLFYFVSTVLNTIFMFIIHSYFGFGVNICILITALIGIIVQIKNLKNVSKDNKVTS